MADQPTCGQGLAHNSALPAGLSRVAGAMAGVLEGHLGALDAGDERARPEYDAYRRLAEEFRQAAARLRETAGRMAGYRDLPMAPHDLAVLAGPEAYRVFAAFVAAKEDLSGLLRESIDEDRALLAQMG